MSKKVNREKRKGKIMGKVCKICGSEKISIEYDGIIRDGATTSKTKNNVKMYKCNECGAIWHDSMKEIDTYYVSEEYRKELEHTSKINDFYAMHDFECFDKFSYTGTECFRNKIVADIGCGGGGFLDFLSGVAEKVVGIEPSAAYRAEMDKRGIETYAYAKEALEGLRGQIDVVVSFDVIEHVESPIQFMKEIYDLLGEGGQAIVGTPTDAPIMRELLGSVYEENLLFSTQHLWVLNENSLGYICRQAGFNEVDIRYKQRYGLGNMISWLLEKKAGVKREYSFVTSTLDKVWKSELEANKKSDYILAYVKK